VKVNNPQRKVVLFPLKSLLYHNSSDRSRIVPVSIGAKEFGEWVTVPATFIFLEKYFWVPGNILQPDPRRQTQDSKKRVDILEAFREKRVIYEYNKVSLFESIHNIIKKESFSS
jgi:hypothetical protein